MSHTGTSHTSDTNRTRDIQFRLLFITLTGIGILIYWGYMTLLEQQNIGFEGFILRMFKPKVLRHAIPLIVGFWLARTAALTLVELLYNLPDRHVARIYLSGRHSRYNKGDAIPVTKKNLEELRLKSTTIGVGGPGLIQISHGEVAITERDGRVSNIHEAGIHYLEMLERIHSILDLKPQTRKMSGMLVYTREYMPIMADVTLRFRIDTGNIDADNGTPYPVDKKAVRTIVYGQNLTKDGPAGWDGKTNFAVRFNLLKVIRRYTMSQILFSENVYANIHNELIPHVTGTLKSIGFSLIGIRVTNIKPKNEAVFKEYKKLWYAKLKIKLKAEEEIDQASHKQEVQTDKSEAELRMIEAIIEGVDKARQDGSVIDVKTAVSLRLIQAMEGLVTQAEENQFETVSPELATSRATLALLQTQLHEQNQDRDD